MREGGVSAHSCHTAPGASRQDEPAKEKEWILLLAAGSRIFSCEAPTLLGQSCVTCHTLP